MKPEKDSSVDSGQSPPSVSSNERKEPSKTNPVTSSAINDALFTVAICMAQFLSLASLGQTMVPLPIIGAHFGVYEPGKLSWLTAAFGLTAGTFILPAGRLGDIYGLKFMYIIGFLFFAFWSLIAGFSAYSNLILLSVCRGLQGLGSAIVVPNSMALIGTTYWRPEQEKKRNMVYGFFAASAPTGFVAGSVMACIFAQFAWWPWAFWSLAIALIANAAIVYYIIPPDSVLREHMESAQAAENESSESNSNEPSSDTEKSPTEKNETSSSGTDNGQSEKAEGQVEHKVVFDYWGCFTGVTGLVLFNFAWNQAPVASWSTPYIIAILILGVLFLIAFYFVETKVATQPLVPFKDLSARNNLTLAVLAAGWGSFGIWTYYFFQRQQLLLGYLPLTTAAMDAFVIPSGLAASIITGRLLSRMNVSTILLIATCCFLTGQTLLATAPLDQSFWIQVFLSLIIMPWGMDMSFPSGTALVSAGMPARYQGTASSLVDTVVNYSISLGLGFAGTIDKNISGVEDTRGAGLPGPTGNSGLYPGGDFEKNKALFAGYQASWYFGIGLDVLGVIIALGFVASDYVNKKRESKRPPQESKRQPQEWHLEGKQYY